MHLIDPIPSLADTTAYLHAEIPLTRAMGIQLSAWDGHTVSLAAPLAPNQNHANTAFGGSISSLGILAGYSLLYLLFQQKKLSTRILIQKSATDFVRPIDSDLLATATAPPAAALDAFFVNLTRKRRARISLDSQILAAGTKSLAATHTGLYVALLY